jgi:type I restriction enzyme S subunit
VSDYKPYPAYKDSGVEWIGKVPEHWEVVRIKRTAQIVTDRCNAIPSGLPYIGLEDVESGSGQYKPTATTLRQSDDSTVGLFQAGDVLYGKLRPYLRKCITGPIDGACSTEFLVLKPASVSPEWLQNWLLTHGVTQQIEAGCDGAKMPRADWEHVGSIHIPAPGKMEQDAILDALSRKTTRIDSLITKTQRSIDLIKERRAAFITAAVTGKIDLRESA